MIKNYSCFIHRPQKSVPNFLAVTCAGADRALVHAERVASEWNDWWVIEIYEGDRRVVKRERGFS